MKTSQFKRNLKMKNWLFAFMLLINAAFGQGDPVELINNKDLELQKLLKGNASKKSKAKREKIKELINDIFDFKELGRKALGSKTYKTFSEEQKTRFTNSFKTMVENSSMKSLEVYKSDSTRYEAPVYKSGKQKAKVVAHTFYKGRESILVYKLWVVDGNWRAWDLVIDDLSTYRQYKERFSRTLKKKSIDQLIEMLEKKGKSKDSKKRKGRSAERPH